MKKIFTFLMIFSFNMAFSQRVVVPQTVEGLLIMTRLDYSKLKEYLIFVGYDKICTVNDYTICFAGSNGDKVYVSNRYEKVGREISYSFNSDKIKADILGQCSNSNFERVGNYYSIDYNGIGYFCFFENDSDITKYHFRVRKI